MPAGRDRDSAPPDIAAHSGSQAVTRGFLHFQRTFFLLHFVLFIYFLTIQSVSFPDSLVSLVDMDVGAIEGMIQQLNDTLWQLTLTQDKQYEERASALLDELAPYHIYFQQFRLD